MTIDQEFEAKGRVVNVEGDYARVIFDKLDPMVVFATILNLKIERDDYESVVKVIFPAPISVRPDDYINARGESLQEMAINKIGFSNHLRVLNRGLLRIETIKQTYICPCYNLDWKLY